MNEKPVEEALEEIASNRELIEEYNSYWKNITPANDKEIFRRYVFSFLSVHTPWSGNVRSFHMLDDLAENDYTNQERLQQVIYDSRAGNYRTKSKGIHRFTEHFNRSSEFYKLTNDKDVSHQAQRDIIMTACYGLGLAKTAFALEMCYPLTAQIVCLDTHMLQLYGYTDGKERAKAGSDPDLYHEMETHWVETCNKHNMSPVIARAIWWDKKQRQKNSRYWTYVLE
mgnify:FL=1